MLSDGRNMLTCLGLLLCTIAFLPIAAGANAAQFLKLQEQTPCQPWTVEPRERQGLAHVLLHDKCMSAGWQPVTCQPVFTFADAATSLRMQTPATLMVAGRPTCVCITAHSQAHGEQNSSRELRAQTGLNAWMHGRSNCVPQGAGRQAHTHQAIKQLLTYI